VKRGRAQNPSSMRRRLPRRPLLAAALAAASALAVLPAAAVVPTGRPIPAGTFTSDNVEWYGTIPLDSPGVGGRVVTRPDDGVRYFYATGAYGLSIYDTTDPAQPTLVSHLPFPHSQNEDVSVADDGTRVVLAADGSLPYSPNAVTTGVHIINVDDVTAPFFEGSTGQQVAGRTAVRGASEHTVTCADPACEYLYGSSGQIYDATDPAAITIAGRWNVDAAGERVRGTHDLNRDATGLLISDSDTRLVLAVTPDHAPGASYTTPVVLAQGASAEYDAGKVDHNNARLDAAEWTPRDPSEPVATLTEGVDFTVPARSHSVAAVRPALRPGELFLGTTESNVSPRCGNVGGFSTWSMVDYDRGAPLQQLEVFRPYNGTWADGSPAAQAAGCSGHWFTERDGVVAAAWYEHGTHFFEVDRVTGTITEVGYFQSVSGISSAAYWIDDEFVYTVDGPRGIDIIRFDREEEAPAQEDLTAAWLRSLDWVSPAAEELRRLCYLAAAGTREG
jgi:hypothetical protein